MESRPIVRTWWAIPTSRGIARAPGRARGEERAEGDGGGGRRGGSRRAGALHRTGDGGETAGGGHGPDARARRTRGLHGERKGPAAEAGPRWVRHRRAAGHDRA